jgi:hypothetical protein
MSYFINASFSVLISVISQPRKNLSRKGCVFLMGISELQLNLSVRYKTLRKSEIKEHHLPYVTKYTTCNIDT